MYCVIDNPLTLLGVIYKWHGDIWFQYSWVQMYSFCNNIFVSYWTCHFNKKNTSTTGKSEMLPSTGPEMLKIDNKNSNQAKQ